MEAVEVEVVLGTDCYLSASTGSASSASPAAWEHKVKIKRPWLALAQCAARPAAAGESGSFFSFDMGHCADCALLGDTLGTYTTPCRGGGFC